MRACSTSFSGFRALAARRGPAYSLASSGESGGYHHQDSHGHTHAESTFKQPHRTEEYRPKVLPDTLTLASSCRAIQHRPCCHVLQGLSRLQLHKAEQNIYSGWMIASAALMCDWLDRVRQAAGSADQEYALVPTIATSAASQLIDFRRRDGWTPDGWSLPTGTVPFPEYYAGSRTDFGKNITVFNEEL